MSNVRVTHGEWHRFKVSHKGDSFVLDVRTERHDREGSSHPMSYIRGYRDGELQLELSQDAGGGMSWLDEEDAMKEWDKVVRDLARLFPYFFDKDTHNFYVNG